MNQSGDKYPYDCAVMQNNNEVADYLRQNKGKSIKDNQGKIFLLIAALLDALKYA